MEGKKLLFSYLSKEQRAAYEAFGSFIAIIDGIEFTFKRKRMFSVSAANVCQLCLHPVEQQISLDYEWNPADIRDGAVLIQFLRIRMDWRAYVRGSVIIDMNGDRILVGLRGKIDEIIQKIEATRAIDFLEIY